MLSISKERNAKAPAPSTGAPGGMLSVRGLRCGYGKTEIVHGVDFEVHGGEFVCVLGPNGCGKTTTLKAVLGLIEPIDGTIEMDGVSTIGMSEAERARLFAYIPQAHTPPFPFTVADVVLLGRTPHLRGMGHVRERDEEAAYACMERMGVVELAERPYTELSGGQRQLVLIARALAQEPLLLVMDEPTASLDFGNQQLVLSQMRALAGSGASVLMVTHDPNHALFCANRVIVMEEGVVAAEGDPDEVVSTELLRRIYRGGAQVVEVAAPDGPGPTRVCIPALGK